MTKADIFEQQGFGNAIGFGKRPALVFVDFTVGFNDPSLFGGGNVSAAIIQAWYLLAMARELGVPVAHTRIVYADDGSDAGAIATKVPTLATLTETNPAGHIVSELRPIDGELIVRKAQPSAFFGTGLQSWLTHKGIDTLIVGGCTTSGCVRATVVDAASFNYRTIVASDCCGDRSVVAHDNSLFDMQQKYADILDSKQISERLRSILS